MSFLSNAVKNYRTQVKKNLQGMVSSWVEELLPYGGKFSEKPPLPLGSLGDIIFEVSTTKVITFRDMKRTAKARYASHEIIGKKPLLEYLAPEAEEISFSMFFSVSLGIEPKEQTAKLRALCECGEAMPFVLGGETVGKNLWMIEQVGEAVDAVDNEGRIIVTTVDVTLKEYISQAESER